MRRILPTRPGSVLLAAVALVVLLLAAGVVGARVATAPEDRIPPGVSIAGVQVGGMTRDQAERAVSDLAGPATGAIVIDAPGAEGFPVRVPVARLAPIPRARIAVDEAMEPRSVGERILRELGLGEDREIGIEYRVAGGPLNTLVARIRERLERPARDARVRVDESALRLVPARDGRRVRTRDLREALTRLPRRIEVPVAAVPPAIDDAAARSARVRARRMVQGPVRVVGPGDRSVVLPTRPLTQALRFVPRGPAIAVDLDRDAVAAMIGDTFAALEREPRSARFVVEDPRVRVVPGAVGRSVDIETTTRAVRSGRGARDVRVRLQRTEPSLTTAAAREMGIRERISEFGTPYTCCPPRVTNIRLGVEALDGTIIPAGGTFSLNEAMGERTEARGFVAAPQINAGELEDAVGGGVSQIATTMFNAAFFGGLELVSHTPHEFWITRYPPGREATVSWGGPELIIRNDWTAAVLVKASAGDDGMRVRLYSSELGRRVETTGADPADASAGQAFTATYTRKVYAGDELTRDETYSWTYVAPPPD